jgi:hypothetical protein
VQELVVSPKGKRVVNMVLAVLRNNTLTPLQYLKGQSTYWRVSQHALKLNEAEAEQLGVVPVAVRMRLP